MQLNSRLARRVIEEIVDEELKPPPSSPDVDLGMILRHAIDARSRQVVCDVALTVLIGILLWSFFNLRAGVFLITLVLVWAVLFAEQLIATYGVVARHLRPGAFDPAEVPEPSDPRLRRRLEQIDEAGRGNVTVYGSYVPFVGRGVPVSAWSFALNVQRPAEGRRCTSFSSVEIHDEVARRISELKLPGLSIEDRLFVDGEELRGDKRFLVKDFAPPTTTVPAVLVRQLIKEPENAVRPYTCITVTSWGGQLVFSTFLRLVATSQHLFVESSHSVLAPVRQEYQEVDHLLPQPTLRQLITIAGRSTWRAPLRLLRAPGAAARAFVAPLRRSQHLARQRREISQSLNFNYGSSPSPRERAADANFQRYFQQLDRDMNNKIVEETILAAIVTFLDDKGIDTSDLVQRQTTILNNGVYVTGQATVNAQAMAAGTGSQATTGIPRAAQAARAMAPAQRN